MIYSYGITQQGTYHVKNNIVCQDAHNIIKCSDTMAVAAVADGLGSEQYSDIASSIAAKVSTQYCAEHLSSDSSEKEVLDAIHNAFTLSQAEIEKTAKANSHELDQYDTTLSLAVLIDDSLYFGQSGDSGIVALTADGFYEKVTTQQRDPYGRVFPLFFGDDKWVFGKYTKPVASVLLATDGMFETLFPYLIQNEPVSIYVALARYFMDPDVLGIENRGEDDVQTSMNDFIASISDEQVNDDKTVVVIGNTAVEVIQQPDEYYKEPNWVELKRKRDEEWRRAAYPHLYNKENADIGKKEDQSIKDGLNENTEDRDEAPTDISAEQEDQLPEDWRDWDD